jgi:hypothetical protein
VGTGVAGTIVLGARAHRDADVVAGKLAQLREPHIAPVTELVERIRDYIGHDQVP